MPGQPPADRDDDSPFAEAQVSGVRASRGAKDVDGRSRLLAALPSVDRLAHLAPAAAQILGADQLRIRPLLERAARSDGYVPTRFAGVSTLRARLGPGNGVVAEFVRVIGGASFPSHGHLGRETILILQGSCLVEETGAILRSGDSLVSTEADVHAIVARPGPDLVYLVVNDGGIRLGETPRTS